MGFIEILYRRVRAVFSAEYLRAWLLEHPDRNNADAQLWIDFSIVREFDETTKL